jgi:hypothetical protein
MDQRNLAYRTALRFKAFDPIAASPIRNALKSLRAWTRSRPTVFAFAEMFCGYIRAAEERSSGLILAAKHFRSNLRFK